MKKMESHCAKSKVWH